MGFDCTIPGLFCQMAELAKRVVLSKLEQALKVLRFAFYERFV